MASLSDAQLRQQCKRVIARELSLYDRLSRDARLKYERKVVDVIDKDNFPSYSCGHGVPLYEPCTKCTRTIEECEVYRRDALRRLQELLNELK